MANVLFIKEWLKLKKLGLSEEIYILQKNLGFIEEEIENIADIKKKEVILFTEIDKAILEFKKEGW